MSYTKTTWRNNQAPAINADNLNHMEQGIESAHNQIDVNTSNIESLTTQVQNNATNIASEISARQTTDSSLQSQIDQLVAPTGEAPNPAEIENARIGDDGVTYDTLGNAIRTQFSDVKSDLSVVIEDVYTDITDQINWSVNGYYSNGDTSGELQSTSDAKTAFIDVSEGDVFKISGRSYYAQKLLCLYENNNDTPISKYSPNNEEVTYTNEVVTIPSGITKIGVAYYRIAGLNLFKLEKLQTQLKPIDASNTDFFEKNEPTNLYNYKDAVLDNYINPSTGAAVSSAGSCYCYVPISESGEYICHVSTSLFGDSLAARIPYFDKNKNFLSYVTGTLVNTGITNFDILTFTLPNSAKFIAISNRDFVRFRIMLIKGSVMPADYQVSFESYVALDDNEKVNATNIKGASANPLFRKTVAFDGDSICSGLSAGDGKGGWGGRIGEINEMNWMNVGTDGGTISNNSNHCLMNFIDIIHSRLTTVDYYIFDGGVNDADILQASGIGTLSPNDFSGNYDTDTFTGAFEMLLYKALTYFPTTKIGYIVAQKMGKTNNANYAIRKTYFDRAIEICKKWGIPYIDLWDGSHLNPNLTSMYDSTKTSAENISEKKMYTDGQHLTPTGYEYVTPIIEAWMKTL